MPRQALELSSSQPNSEGHFRGCLHIYIWDGDGVSQRLSSLQDQGDKEAEGPVSSKANPLVLSTWLLFSACRFPRQPAHNSCSTRGRPPGPFPFLLLVPAQPLPPPGAVSPAHGSHQQPGALLVFRSGRLGTRRGCSCGCCGALPRCQHGPTEFTALPVLLPIPVSRCCCPPGCLGVPIAAGAPYRPGTCLSCPEQ